MRTIHDAPAAERSSGKYVSGPHRMQSRRGFARIGSRTGSTCTRDNRFHSSVRDY
jgi:hypothetical protein